MIMRKLLLLVLILLVGCTTQKMDSMEGMDKGMDMKDMPMDDMDAPMMKMPELRMPAEGMEPIGPAKRRKVWNIINGEEVELSVDVVTKKIAGHTLKLYGYNGQLPGPMIKVKQGDKIKIKFTNNIDMDTTIHWHGLRHANKDDGVPGTTQDPIKPGETFTYELYFPDDGMYWYHPHVREDLQQDAGLAGNMWVLPEETWNDVDKEEVLILDDILIEDGLVGYGKESGDRVLMGRFGNVMLVNWEEKYYLNVNAGEIVRFYITNVANARVFNLSFTNARIKRVGGDMGLYEKDEFIDSIVIAPAERYILEVMFEDDSELLHINPEKTYKLGEIKFSKGDSHTFTLKEHAYVIADVAQYSKYFDKEIDYQLDLTIDMDMGHKMPKHELERIEWEDSMKMMNAMSNTDNVRWVIRDHETGKENMNFTMKAKIGDVLKIRLFNDPKSEHPMQHPIHLHGQRFLVIDRNGEEEDNHVWKDTVLVPAGEYVDILVDVTNPGTWMMHCHISEHLEAGMMSSLIVE